MSPARLLVVGLLTSVALRAFADDCPEQVGRWPYGSAKSVAVLGTHAYVGASTYDGASNTLFVVDVSNPTAPRVVGQAPLTVCEMKACWLRRTAAVRRF
jgi:hypothetical protein